MVVDGWAGVLIGEPAGRGVYPFPVLGAAGMAGSSSGFGWYLPRRNLASEEVVPLVDGVAERALQVGSECAGRRQRLARVRFIAFSRREHRASARGLR